MLKFLSVVAAGVASVAGCTSDEDCSLNGLCTGGECVCDEGWTTLAIAEDKRECGQLDFLPAKVSSCGSGCAFHGGSQNTSSWGGNVNVGDDGKFWLHAAVMAQGCSLKHWTTNSEVASAVSDTPEGLVATCSGISASRLYCFMLLTAVDLLRCARVPHLGWRWW